MRTASSSGESGGRGRTLQELLLLMPLLTGAFFALPVRTRMGPLSIMAFISVLFFFVLLTAIVVRGRIPMAVARRVSVFVLFLVWILIQTTMLWTGLDVQGVQHLVVYSVFLLLLVVAGAQSGHCPVRSAGVLAAAFLLFDIIGLGLVALEIGRSGLAYNDNWRIGARVFGVVALIPVSWHLSRWISGSWTSLIRALAWQAAIYASLSRTAFVVGLSLFVTAALLRPGGRLFRVCRALGVLLACLLLFYGLMASGGVFARRFTEGDLSFEIGGHSINMMGRILMWSATVTSGVEAPWAGKGLGSASRLMSDLFLNINHPHSEWLRLWHDLGVVGVGLVIAAIGCWLWILVVDYHAQPETARSAKALLASGILCLQVISLTMITDNTMIYMFVMGPAGVLIGMALGVGRHHRRAEILSS